MMSLDLTLLDMRKVWISAAIAGLRAGRNAKEAASQADGLMEEIIIRDRVGTEARALSKVDITKHA